MHTHHSTEQDDSQMLLTVFAAIAMHALLRAENDHHHNPLPVRAFDIADAMLKEFEARSKR